MIIVPFTHEIPEATSVALFDYPHVLAYVGDSDTAYWELLAAWWASTEPDVLIIEHDIEVSAAGIKMLLDCEHSWCPAWYPFEGSEIYGLGLTKLSLPLRLAVPDAMEREGEIEEPGKHPKKHWCSIDAWLQGILREAGQVPHVHRVPVKHHSTRRSHVACR